MPDMADFAPENALEETLAASAASASRADFYRALLAADLYVLGAAQQLGGEQTLSLRQWEIEGRQGEDLQIEDLHVLPVFSSLERLQAFINEESSYIRIKTRLLLELLGPDVTLLLNPGSAYGAELSPAVVRALRDGSLLAEPAPSLLLGGQQIMLAEPQPYPTALVSAWQRVLEGSPMVRVAYLAQIHQNHAPDSAAPAHFLLGFDTEADFDALVNACMAVVGDRLAVGAQVDFIQIGQGALSAHLQRKFSPFFIRSIDNLAS